MDTSTVMVQQFATTTGQIITDSLPLVWLLLGLFLFIMAVGTILRVFKRASHSAFKS